VKLITAVLAPERLDAVAAALAEVEVYRMTVTECRGVQPGTPDRRSSFLTKSKLEIAVNENFVRPTMEAVASVGLRFEDDAQRAEVLEVLAGNSAFTLGALQEDLLPAALEAPSDAENTACWRWARELPGVRHLEVIHVAFDELEE